MYEHKSESELQLRLRNNSSCPIVVETDERYPLTTPHSIASSKLMVKMNKPLRLLGNLHFHQIQKVTIFTR